VCSGIDEDGNGITSMSFAVNGSTIHTATPTSPSEDKWEASHTYTPATGTHTISCSATDSEGTTASNSYSFGVVENAGVVPAFTITAPDPAANYAEPASFAIQVDTSKLEGIDRIDFYSSDVLLGTRHTNFEYVWTHAPAGTYVLHARATRDDGETVLSDSVTVTVEPGTSAGDPVTQSVSLEKGWNVISTRVAPDPSEVESIFSSIADHVSLVKDDQGAVYIPGAVNEIEHWNPLQAYAVYVTEEKTLAVNGMTLQPGSTPVPLTKGWNMVPFLSETSLPITDALSSISDVLIMAKDARGNVYVPQFDVDEIEHLVPGRGYRLFVSDNAELFYPNSEAKALRSTPSTTE
jgi:hypothetical protein